MGSGLGEKVDGREGRKQASFRRAGKASVGRPVWPRGRYGGQQALPGWERDQSVWDLGDWLGPRAGCEGATDAQGWRRARRPSPWQE